MTLETLTKEFLEAIVPQDNKLCLATLPRNKKGEAGAFRQTFYGRTNGTATLDAMLERMESNQSIDSYFALASFGPQAGGRTQDNVKHIRVLAIDVDIKDDPKFFSSKVEALPALKNLLSQVPASTKVQALPW